jgi:hypothetical protein
MHVCVNIVEHLPNFCLTSIIINVYIMTYRNIITCSIFGQIIKNVILVFANYQTSILRNLYGNRKVKILVNSQANKVDVEGVTKRTSRDKQS